MIESPSISIIIPVYQVSDYIIACLGSVSNQSYEGKLECILVDDCGADNSIALANEFIHSYHGPIAFCICSHSSNKGLSSARNTGMHKATGDYLLFLDSDDELMPDAIKNLSLPLVNEKYDIVVGQVKVSGSKIDYNCSLAIGTILRGDAIRDAYAKRLITTMACNKLYSRKMLKQKSHTFYEGIIHEDELWSLNVYMSAQSLYIIGEQTYLYKIRANSIVTNSQKNTRIASLHIIACKMQEYLVKHKETTNALLLLRVESFKSNILKELLPNKTQFKMEYLQLRETDPKDWFGFLKQYKFGFIKQLRMIHYALPPNCGYAYHYIWLLLEKSFTSKNNSIKQ